MLGLEYQSGNVRNSKCYLLELEGYPGERPYWNWNRPKIKFVEKHSKEGCDKYFEGKSSIEFEKESTIKTLEGRLWSYTCYLIAFLLNFVMFRIQLQRAICHHTHCAEPIRMQFKYLYSAAYPYQNSLCRSTYLLVHNRSGAKHRIKIRHTHAFTLFNFT